MNIEASGIILRRLDGKILLLHRRPEVPEGGKYGLPGGKRLSEKTFQESAIAKTIQEIGIEFTEDEISLLGEFDFEAEGSTVKYVAFLAELNQEIVNINLNLEGHDSYDWFDSEEASVRSDMMVGIYPILNRLNSI